MFDPGPPPTTPSRTFRSGRFVVSSITSSQNWENREPYSRTPTRGVPFLQLAPANMLGQFLDRGLLLRRLEDDLPACHHEKPVANTAGVIKVMRDQQTQKALHAYGPRESQEGLG